MNTMPDPTCPECGDERWLRTEPDNPGYLYWYCPTCARAAVLQQAQERQKLAAWNAWARGETGSLLENRESEVRAVPYLPARKYDASNGAQAQRKAGCVLMPYNHHSGCRRWQLDSGG